MDNDTPSVDIDDIDLEILKRVERDYDVNLQELSNALGLSRSAIHYRLNKLKDANVIRDVSARIDPLTFGLEMMMITEVSVVHDEGYANDIGGELTELDGVLQVYYTMGDVDFVLISRTRNREQMNALIEEIVAIDGVTETSSTFVMDELKTDNKTLSNVSDEMIADAVQSR